MDFVTPLFANCQVNQACAFKAAICLTSVLPQPAGKKNTLKINLKCSIQSSVEYLRTFLTEAYFSTIFALDFPAYLMLKEFAKGLAVRLFGCWLFFYRNSNSPRKTPAIKTTKPSNKDKIRTEKMGVGAENDVSSVCKDSHSVRGLNGKKLNCSKN